MSSNLWSYHPDTTSGGVRLLWDGEKINYSNTCTNAANSIMTIDLKKGTYTLKVNANRIPVENENSCIDVYHSSSGLFKKITNRNAVNGKVTFTLDDDLSNVSLRIRLNNGTNYDGFEIRPMLNIGETSLPYDVYGQYKIPISSANTTTPVYLGEVETTRRIGKIDLSELSWTQVAQGLWKTIDIPNIKYVSVNTELGDGIAEKYTIHTGSDMTTALNCIAIDVLQVLVNTGSALEKPTGMFWYVLAEPETAVVNEPLRKIGDYADTVSGITIPTITGTNTIDVETTLKPSEVSVNYHGWHPVIDVHRFNGTSWD